MRTIICPFLLASALSIAACGTEAGGLGSDSFGELQASLLKINGLRINGLRINGLRINGLRINGLRINGTTISGIGISGSGQLVAIGSDGSLSPASSVADLQLEAPQADGSTVLLRIDSEQQDAASGVYVYAVSHQDSKGKWQPACGKTGNDPILAVPMLGSYDLDSGSFTPSQDQLMFGCNDGALGKCALWGYRPWEEKTECQGSVCKQQSMQPWHHACTRLVRADYCGDGVPHTRNGTSINVWDNMGVQAPASTDWDMEAEWTTDGARCIRHTRWLKADKKAALTDLEYIQRTCPDRLASNQPASCGESSSDFTSTVGYDVVPTLRRLLRNQSQGWLTGTGHDKKGNKDD